MLIKSFYDKTTATFTYLIIDEKSNKCAVIDPALTFDLESKKVSFEAMEALLTCIEGEHLTLEWILETHIHADHLTGASFLKERCGGLIGMGENVREVYQHWQPLLKQDIPKPEFVFDHLFEDNDSFLVGSLMVKVLKTPGHTPSCVSYQVQDNIFVGDTLFMPHLGTARADFPGGSAETLYHSIQKIYALPNHFKVYVGHDYPKPEQSENSHVSVEEQKNTNNMLNMNTSLTEYIEKRTARDLTLSAPKLLMPSLRANLEAGRELL